jgi:uncharacterized protein YoxC
MDFDPGKTLKDAAYITVGVGVTAFQQGQVRRREVQKKVTEQAKETSTYLATRAQDSRVKLETLANDVRAKANAARDDVSGRVEPLVGDLGQRVQPIVEQLQTVPAQVKQAAEAGVTRAKELVNRASGPLHSQACWRRSQAAWGPPGSSGGSCRSSRPTTSP